MLFQSDAVEVVGEYLKKQFSFSRCLVTPYYKANNGQSISNNPLGNILHLMAVPNPKTGVYGAQQQGVVDGVPYGQDFAKSYYARGRWYFGDLYFSWYCTAFGHEQNFALVRYDYHDGMSPTYQVLMNQYVTTVNGVDSTGQILQNVFQEKEMLFRELDFYCGIPEPLYRGTDLVYAQYGFVGWQLDLD